MCQFISSLGMLFYSDNSRHRVRFTVYFFTLTTPLACDELGPAHAYSTEDTRRLSSSPDQRGAAGPGPSLVCRWPASPVTQRPARATKTSRPAPPPEVRGRAALARNRLHFSAGRASGASGRSRAGGEGAGQGGGERGRGEESSGEWDCGRV